MTVLHEERTANILINKAGENAGPDANGYRVALPSAWMKDLGISEGSRTVTLQFDGESITIRRPAVSDYNVFLANARSSAHALLILYYYDGNKLCTKICRSSHVGLRFTPKAVERGELTSFSMAS